MQRPALEVADIFRDFGSAWLVANRGRVSHAVKDRRMAALGVLATRNIAAERRRAAGPDRATHQ
jgi:hypothetical protein